MSSRAHKIQFEELYQQYHPMVLQMCRGYMKGHKEPAKDLAQEVFINVWNALPNFKGISSHKTWIYRITVNSCLNYLRNKKDQADIPIETIEQKHTDDSQPLETEIAKLYAAIGRLAEIDRLIIMMVLNETDYDEIAQVMGLSSGNLRVRIHRIKKNLKNDLNNAN
ncbi:sigma-70 family RNA polymerase sigma factor [uncultured Draconibacterium sp.]|uniref:RNA polymerase sigma factor n=1 Tax=uncultured Draconibacterium sp. TaxID=1573823 RepID=UPI0029C7037B|nr:sigma-70 family RNA polymerase sigma factor [uncultured Draconibacterium sp.]